MLSSPGLRLAFHVGNTLGARHTIRKVCFESRKSLLLVEPSLQIRPLSSFLSKGCSCRRWFQRKPLPQEGSLSPPTSVASKPSPSLKKDSDFVTKGDIPTLAEQRRSDWGITKRLLVNVWPKNDWKTRWVVLLGLGLLVSSKVSVLLSRPWGYFTDYCHLFRRYSMFKCRKYSRTSWTRST